MQVLLRLGALAFACLAVVSLGIGCGGGDEDGGIASGANGGKSGSGGSATGGNAGSGGSGGTGGFGGNGSSCANQTLDTSALAFDGVDDQVSMGAAPELGLAQFTVEAWVRRDGAGKTFSTGQGGLSLVPIAGKGRGEADGSNVDANYAFGFYGDVLGADFEDMATGANHPVLGKTALAIAVWHHVAATYDGTRWRLYLNGVLDAESPENATPRSDSIQHFGVGAAFDSKGVAAGALHGAIDELRIWNRALDSSEIAAGMYETKTSGSGLVARYALDQADKAVVDTVGSNDGTLTGATFVEPGAVLGVGKPPVVSGVSPADDAVVTGTSVELSLAPSDPEGEPTVVTFYARELGSGDDFTIVVMPDTQYYTVEGNGYEKYFYDQTKWIMDNRVDYNIVAVIHNGDIVDHGNTYDYEWTIADKAMKTLETPAAGLLEGMPYGVGVGNHDQSPNGTPGGTAKFNTWFGVPRFQDRTYYGGHYAADLNDDNWFTFSAGGLDFVVVNLQYDTSQDPAVVAWAKKIFEAHPSAFGILNSHYILTSQGEFGAQGQAIYDGLLDVPNLHLMTCGHISAESRREDTSQGHTIFSMLADYQGRANGGSGWMRIWEFSPANGELTVRTYSPTLGEWETDENSEFTLPVNLAGSGGSFSPVATLDPAPALAQTTFSGLKPGHAYEWYAELTDCRHVLQTPLMRFTTAP